MAMVIMSSTDKNGKQSSYVHTSDDNSSSGNIIVCGNGNHVGNLTTHAGKICKFCKKNIYGNDFITTNARGKKVEYICEDCAEKKGLK